MKIINWIQDTVKFMFDGVSRLFKATDDDYPKTGVQPFSGDSNKNSDDY